MSAIIRKCSIQAICVICCFGEVTAQEKSMVNLVTTTQEEHDMSPLKEALLNLELEGKIVGFLHILNDSLSDVVQSDETRIIYGQDYFYEKLLNLEFKITPFSFFQPNSRGAEVLLQYSSSIISEISTI